MIHLHHNQNEVTRRRNLGVTSAILIGAGIAAAAVGTSSAVSAIDASKERKQQKNMLRDADAKARELEAKTANAAAAADQAAKDKLLAKKRAVTPTILTSPLGVTEEAGSTTARPTLLGGGK